MESVWVWLSMNKDWLEEILSRIVDAYVNKKNEVINALGVIVQTDDKLMTDDRLILEITWSGQNCNSGLIIVPLYLTELSSMECTKCKYFQIIPWDIDKLAECLLIWLEIA